MAPDLLPARGGAATLNEGLDKTMTEDRILTEMGEYAAIVHEVEPMQLHALFDDPQCSDKEYLGKLERAIALIQDSSDTHYMMTTFTDNGREGVEDTVEEFGTQMEKILVLERLRYRVLGKDWRPFASIDNMLSGRTAREYYDDFAERNSRK